MNIEIPFNQDLEASADLKSSAKGNQVINQTGKLTEILCDPILCDHCQRTATNGIKCQGICVADSAY
jgi:hypothetical protein